MSKLTDFMKAFFLPRMVTQKGYKNFVKTMESEKHLLFNIETIEELFSNSIFSVIHSNQGIHCNKLTYFQVTITDLNTKQIIRQISFPYFTNNNSMESPIDYIDTVTEIVKKRFGDQHFKIEVINTERRNEFGYTRYQPMHQFISYSFYIDTFFMDKNDEFSVFNDKTGISQQNSKNIVQKYYQ